LTPGSDFAQQFGGILEQQFISGYVHDPGFINQFTQDAVAALWNMAGTQGPLLPQLHDYGPSLLSDDPNHLFMVSEPSGFREGTYRFRVIDLQSDSMPLATGAVATGVLDPGSRTIAYRIDAVQGQQLYYDGEGESTGALVQ